MATHKSNNDYDLLKLSSTSRKKLLRIFANLDKVHAKSVYHKILNSVKEVIRNDNVDSLKNLNWLLDNINCIKNKNDLQNYLERHQIGNFNLVALACQKKAIKALEYLFSDKGKFLYNLITNICESDHLLGEIDEFSHNAFYYAIRSNQVDLLRILVDKWCEDKNSVQLEEVLSKEYKELKLRRVFLTNEMELYVRNKILDIRFFQDHADSSKGSGNTWSHIKKRIEMVNRDIDFLKMHYWDTDPDDKFLLKTEFIAKNVHVLKSLLKSTYDKLPWEEIEFILVIFILCCKNRSQTNLVYNSVLNKKKVLSYLESFSVALGCEQRNLKTFDIILLAEPLRRAKSMREKVIKEITKNYPSFQELYIDYETVRDFYSLETVKNYLDLAVTVDVTKKEGQLVVMRALQVMGEHLKNTLQSPKLSDSTAELLLYSLPLNTKDIITKLRDFLSHEGDDDTHFIRSVIEKKPHVFFKNVQTDISKIDVMIRDVLCTIKITSIQNIMKKTRSYKHLNDVKDLFGPFGFSINSFIDEVNETDSDILVKGDIEKLEELLSDLNSKIINKTTQEKGLFDQINNIIKKEKESVFNVREAFLYNTIYLKEINEASLTVKPNRMHYINWIAQVFETFVSGDLILCKEPFMKIFETLLKKILDSAKSRININHGIDFIIMRIAYLMKFNLYNIKGIKKFKGISVEKRKRKRKNTQFLLSTKLSVLKKILIDNDLIDSLLVTNISFFESNIELQTVIEMLVLDVLSTLQDSCNHNQFLLDSEYPLQIGKNLRNHLAHNNALINILLDKSPLQLLLNAIKLTKEDFSRHDMKIDKIILCDPSKLENNHTEDLLIVDNQRELFYCLENGDMKRIQDCIKKGADIYGKDINEMTCLHYSAKAPSTDAIKFVLQQSVDVASKDLKEQTALHTAVKYDRIKIVKYLMKRKLLSINECDIDGKTPLHIAAENGRNDIFKYLLKYETDITIKDNSGLSLLHTAILRRNKEMTEILLKKGGNLKRDVSSGGFTVLHRAAEEGQISLVNMLINMKVDVKCKTNFSVTPLHIASECGHLEVVKTLILNGADVNARTVSGETPLHRAALSGDREIIKHLLNCEAEINAFNIKHYSPLSYAAAVGHIIIVELLLKHIADININFNFGPTPLHIASQNGRFEIVKLLLKHGACINQKNKHDGNRTTLHYSSFNGHFEIVKLLIETGADIEAKDISDNTPLHMAVIQKHYEISDILIAKGADIHSKDALGSTALHLAASHRNEKIVRLLLLHGADIKAEDNNKVTPIHILVSNELIEFLIKGVANIGFVDACGFTTLHLGAFNGNLEFVKYCLENGCNIEARSISGITALHLAVQGNHQDIVNYLIDNGAETNVKDNNGNTALAIAALNNYQNIARILIRKAEYPLHDQNESLFSAVFEGHLDIVRILLKECTFDVRSLEEKHDLLHIAVANDHLNIVNILLENGFDVNAVSKSLIMTPLHRAVLNDHWETAQLLLLKAAYPNAQDQYGRTPLHYAAERGNADLVESLLDENANIFVKDCKNKTVIELAVGCNQLEIFKLLFLKGDIDVDFKGYHDRSLLHQCALTGSLEMTEYLVESGANIHAKCRDGHKPIHLAAVMGFENIVEFYLDHNMSVNDLNDSNLTLLHIAAEHGKANVAELLIKRTANINATDLNGETPIHLASANGHKDVIDIILHNGAYYNVKNKLNQTPLQITENEFISSVLKNLEKLFIAVKNNAPLETDILLNENSKNSEFCLLNANCIENDTLLHCASRNGFKRIVESLLKHKANPNVFTKSKCTPLHFAAEFSHFEIVKLLLTNGTIYNALTCDQKIPLNCAVDENVINLLVFLKAAFIKVQDNNISLLHDLDKMKDLSEVKAVMRAKNADGKTLIEVAILCNFSKTEQLKELYQGNIMQSLELSDAFIQQEKLREAYCEYKRIISERIEIFGPDNPSVLDVQTKLVRLLNIRQNYGESLQLLEEIYQKRQDSLGAYHKETIAVKCLEAVTLFEQGKNEEALHIFKEVIPKQKDILEPNDGDIFESENALAMVLFQMEKYTEASKINYEILEKSIKKFGEFHVKTIYALSNLAATMNKQGKHTEALKLFRTAYAISYTKFPLLHPYNLKALFNIGLSLIFLKKYDESLEKLRQVLCIQSVRLSPNHFDILSIKYHIGAALQYKGMTIPALRIFLALEPKIKIFSPNTRLEKDNKSAIEKIFIRFKMLHQEYIFEGTQNEIKHALNSDVFCPIRDLICVEDEINNLDSIGITTLHLAVVNGDKNMINDLLENGFDVLKVTIEGNTALHTAAIHGYADIADIIIRHTQQHNRSRLDDLINATTAGVLSTALHLATNVDTAMCLLKHGAKFDAKNILDQTPLDLAGDERVFTLLKTVDGIFDSAISGQCCVIDRIRELDPEEAMAASYARNTHGYTLLQVALMNNHRNLAKELGEFLKTLMKKL
ncbi:ankyrin-3 [Nephila pilipes]|uniref:Ankyrin-3 n=1 Tax=Nephila pilipes TaxID=299642 RepID=A0A8X6TB92_NEPPI|nr:ankyrin-3 [Nephila pilipes]